MDTDKFSGRYSTPVLLAAAIGDMMGESKDGMVSELGYGSGRKAMARQVLELSQRKWNEKDDTG